MNGKHKWKATEPNEIKQQQQQQQRENILSKHQTINWSITSSCMFVYVCTVFISLSVGVFGIYRYKRFVWWQMLCYCCESGFFFWCTHVFYLNSISVSIHSVWIFSLLLCFCRYRVSGRPFYHRFVPICTRKWETKSKNKFFSLCIYPHSSKFLCFIFLLCQIQFYLMLL